MNETNIVFRGGWPGAGLRRMAGVWSEEIDSLVPNPPQRIVAAPGNALGLAGEHPVREYCERVHPEGASVLATYKSDFYAGMPALTVNRFGSGRVYYLAARPAEDAFHDGLVRGLVRELGLARHLDVELPEGVTVQKRVRRGQDVPLRPQLHRRREVPRPRCDSPRGRRGRKRPHGPGHAARLRLPGRHPPLTVPWLAATEPAG